MYRLYSAKRSGGAMVEAALAEAGAEYEVVPVDLRADEQRREAHRKLNPAGKVPALVLPSGAVISESAAMLMTIADRFPAASLLPPSGSDARAQAIRWLVFVAAEIYPMVEIEDYPQRFATGELREAAIRFVAQNRARERWRAVEEVIAGDPWLLPDGFSIADLAIANVSRWIHDNDWRIASLPKIEAINAGIFARPKAGEAWKRNFG
jgi:GST-like protein